MLDRIVDSCGKTTGSHLQLTKNSTESYFHLFDVMSGGETLSAWFSIESQDAAWDMFLQQTSLGEFQQTSCWAKVKQIDGWECLRVVLTSNQKIFGGFQVLWRASRWGRIGYVSKGPVAENENKETVMLLVDLLGRAARQLRLIALMVHPPENSRLFSSLLPQARFVPNKLMSIITATLMVDVSNGVKSVEALMRRTTRKKHRRAIRNGIVIREGNERDIGIFFRLMLDTCKRQGVNPVPSTERALMELWRSFRNIGGCRLTLADYDGRTIAGLFCIPFGKIVRFWKKGSMPEHLHLHPVEMLYHEAMSWACSKGYHYCDFVSIDRKIAESLINGISLTENQKKSRDFFNLGFGGHPVILPEAYIYFPNSLLFNGYRLLIDNDFIFRYFKKGLNKYFK